MNMGGGCGEPHCDYQVQCGSCFGASEQQCNEWFARAGYARSMYRLAVHKMRDADHAEALAEDASRRIDPVVARIKGQS